MNSSKRSLSVSTIKIKPFIASFHFDPPLSHGCSPMQQKSLLPGVFVLLVPLDWSTLQRHHPGFVPHVLLFFKGIYSTHLFGCTGSQLQHLGYFYPQWSMWDPVPRSGIKLGLPALGVHTLSHWNSQPPSIVYSHSPFSVRRLLTP